MKYLFAMVPVVALAGCMPEENLDNAVDPDVLPRGRPIAQSPRDKTRLSAANLNEASWNVVRSATASDTRYRQALKWAEQACELNRDDANLLNTLGVAQYRVRDYATARTTLERAQRLRGDKGSGRNATWDLVFLAMTEYQLGAIAKAKTLLKQVQNAIVLHKLQKNRELKRFMREAQSLITPGSRTDSTSRDNL